MAPIQIYFTFRGAGCLCTVQYLAAERHVETALAGNQAAHYQGQDVTLPESKMALTKFSYLSGEQNVCVQYLAAERHIEAAQGGNQAGYYRGQHVTLPQSIVA